MKMICHQGLGDHIIMNAIVRVMASRHDHIVVPVRERYCSSVASMYRDNPAISLHRIPENVTHETYQEDWAKDDPTCLRLRTI